MVTNSQAGLWFYPHFPSFRWEALEEVLKVVLAQVDESDTLRPQAVIWPFCSFDVIARVTGIIQIIEILFAYFL